ncbi:MAG: Nickel transport system permease protein NikB [Firmicutes bacterium]|nr:Nickel transport system permease protein NikB [Bacillota bacterium]
MLRKYISRRIGAAFATVWLATIVVFFLLSLVPGDPVFLMLMEAGGLPPTPEQLSETRARLGFDQPTHVRYMIWVRNMLRGDFGESMQTGLPVATMLRSAFGATIQLALASMVVAIVIAFPAGILAATKQNTIADSAARFGSLLGLSMPSFWLALLLMLLFGLQLRWLPVFGFGTLRHLILPALTVGTGMAALSARLIRSSMLDVLKEDFIRTARAKGLSERVVIWVHALKCAMIPVITILGLQLGFALGGSGIVETVFAWPGMGRMMVTAIFARDFVVVQGVTFMFAVTITTANTLVDILYVYLDPRIRY